MIENLVFATAMFNIIVLTLVFAFVIWNMFFTWNTFEKPKWMQKKPKHVVFVRMFLDFFILFGMIYMLCYTFVYLICK